METEFEASFTAGRPGARQFALRVFQLPTYGVAEDQRAAATALLTAHATTMSMITLDLERAVILAPLIDPCVRSPGSVSLLGLGRI